MSREEEFLRKHFQNFYLNNFVRGPPEISQREFGYGVFGRKIANRHLAFSSQAEFNSFLRKDVPFFVSYSSALYRFPSKRPMEAKELLKADLVYEFDADDLHTECKEKHDSWVCQNCGKSGKGRQLACDDCGSPTKVDEWFCRDCLKEAKAKVFALLDFLENDFGFSDGIAINFSGRAGYHVHVRGDSVRGLSHSARIELIDYLTAKGLSIFSHFKKEDTFFSFHGLEKAGWPSRIIQELQALLEQADAEKIALMGDCSMPLAKKLVEERHRILSSIKERNTIPSFFGRVSARGQSKSDLFWQSFLNSIVAKIAPIDRQTSIDLNKIVRVPETLHGETGLVSKELSVDSLKGFDPFDAGVAFSLDERVKLFINKAPSFYLAGQQFGPFDAVEEELPLAAAVFLLGRGAAVLGGRNEA
jgi:DNA primase small subunit